MNIHMYFVSTIEEKFVLGKHLDCVRDVFMGYYTPSRHEAIGGSSACMQAFHTSSLIIRIHMYIDVCTMYLNDEQPVGLT